MTKTIDFPRLITDVRRHAAERPTFTYPPSNDNTCVYFYPDAQPACIIGHALADQGWTYTDVGPSDTQRDMNVAEFAVLLMELEVPQDGHALDIAWLGQVQAQQDMHVPWGECITYVDGRIDQIAESVL